MAAHVADGRVVLALGIRGLLDAEAVGLHHPLCARPAARATPAAAGRVLPALTFALAVAAVPLCRSLRPRSAPPLPLPAGGRRGYLGQAGSRVGESNGSSSCMHAMRLRVCGNNGECSIVPGSAWGRVYVGPETQPCC